VAVTPSKPNAESPNQAEAILAGSGQIPGGEAAVGVDKIRSNSHFGICGLGVGVSERLASG
jgi:hypothetical protein